VQAKNVKSRLERPVFAQFLLATIFFINGCSSTLSVKDQFGSVFGEEDLTNLDKPLISHLVMQENGEVFDEMALSLVESGYQEDLVETRFAGGSLVDISSLEEYANKVLGRLMKSWAGRTIHAKVFIVSRKDFGGISRKNGAIVIPLGTFRLLENEDQLAALLAHELSHIILEHHQTDVIGFLGNKAFDIGELYLNLSAKNGREEAALKDYSQLKALDWVAHRALIPSWGRVQENEADLLGVDLMVGAGFNADAMVMFLKLVGASAQEKQEYLIKNPVVINKKADQSLSLNFDADSLVKDLFSVLDQELSKEHAEASVRQKKVRGYLKGFYADRKRSDFNVSAYHNVLRARSVRGVLAKYESAYSADELLVSGADSSVKGLNRASRLGLKSVSGKTKYDSHNRLLMYEIRKRQNKQKSAIKNLELALKSGEATYKVYSLLEANAYENKQYKESLKYLSKMKESFGDRDDLVLRLIRSKKSLGEPVSLSLKARCLSIFKSSAIAQCLD